jgi:hypothetical protein
MSPVDDSEKLGDGLGHKLAPNSGDEIECMLGIRYHDVTHRGRPTAARLHWLVGL